MFLAGLGFGDLIPRLFQRNIDANAFAKGEVDVLLHSLSKQRSLESLFSRHSLQQEQYGAVGQMVFQLQVRTSVFGFWTSHVVVFSHLSVCLRGGV